MGLVHRRHGDVHLLHQRLKGIGHETFGRHVDDLILTPARVFHGFAVLAFGQRAIDIGRVDACLVQGGYLIFHQRNEGRYHNGNPLKHKRRNLETDRFSRPRRHNPQDVPAGKGAVNQGFLPFPEGIIAEDIF